MNDPVIWCFYCLFTCLSVALGWCFGLKILWLLITFSRNYMPWKNCNLILTINLTLFSFLDDHGKICMNIILVLFLQVRIFTRQLLEIQNGSCFPYWALKKGLQRGKEGVRLVYWKFCHSFKLISWKPTNNKILTNIGCLGSLPTLMLTLPVTEGKISGIE